MLGIEMASESFTNYVKALKRAMFDYARGKDVERNGKKIKFIFKEFGINIELDKLTILKGSANYDYINEFVDDIFFCDGGIVDKIIFF